MVGQVPASRRHAGQAKGRAGLDGPWATGGRLLHETAGRGLASRHARGGSARLGRPPGCRRRRSVDPAWVRIRGCGSVRRDVRRRCRRVPALLGAGPRLQAVDGPQLPQRDQRPSAARVRRDGARGHHGAGDRAVARGDVQRPPAARALEQDQEQPARAHARESSDARSSSTGCRRNPVAKRRSLPRPQQRRHPGVLARGGLGAWCAPRAPRPTRRSS